MHAESRRESRSPDYQGMGNIVEYPYLGDQRILKSSKKYNHFFKWKEIKLKMSGMKMRGRGIGLKMCWLVMWLVASISMTKSRETVTAGWTAYFRSRTQESGKMHNDRGLCPFSCLAWSKHALSFESSVPEKHFITSSRKLMAINSVYQEACHFQSWSSVLEK